MEMEIEIVIVQNQKGTERVCLINQIQSGEKVLFKEKISISGNKEKTGSDLVVLIQKIKTREKIFSKEEILKNLEIPISELDIQNRTYNCLLSKEFKYCKDIVFLEKLPRIRNFGSILLEDLKHKLSIYGLSLGMKKEDFYM